MLLYSVLVRIAYLHLMWAIYIHIRGPYGWYLIIHMYGTKVVALLHIYSDSYI